MSLSEEFHDYAAEHFGWAETARTERERAIFLQMAAAWLEVAQRWEGHGPSTQRGALRSHLNGLRVRSALVSGTRKSKSARQMDWQEGHEPVYPR
jgi:hypothetical protein